MNRNRPCHESRSASKTQNTSQRFVIFSDRAEGGTTATARSHKNNNATAHTKCSHENAIRTRSSSPLLSGDRDVLARCAQVHVSRGARRRGRAPNARTVRTARKRLSSFLNRLCPFGPSRIVKWTDRRPLLRPLCSRRTRRRCRRCRRRRAGRASGPSATGRESPGCTVKQDSWHERLLLRRVPQYTTAHWDIAFVHVNGLWQTASG